MIGIENKWTTPPAGWIDRDKQRLKAHRMHQAMSHYIGILHDTKDDAAETVSLTQVSSGGVLHFWFRVEK